MCALIGSQIVGIGRVVGDGAIYFYIQDVIILPKYQKNGIGNAIMNEIESYLQKNAIKGSFIGLMAAEGVEVFYKQFGYMARPAKRPGMYKIF